MEQEAQNGMKRESVNVDPAVVFARMNNVGMIINSSVNAKN